MCGTADGLAMAGGRSSLRVNEISTGKNPPFDAGLGRQSTEQPSIVPVRLSRLKTPNLVALESHPAGLFPTTSW